ncbi:hypothetical protein MMC22_006986 [Lobaria immixta]|nr:hypothetical protein [Lobaria immixta]
MSMTWNSIADQNLLLAILSEHSISVDYAAVALRLGCTPRAVQERLKKLRKRAVEQDGEGEAVETTPVKRTGKGAKTAKKDGKSGNTEPVAMGTKKAKKGDPKVITTQEAHEKKSEVGGAVQGIKRKRTDDDEETEKTEGMDR